MNKVKEKNISLIIYIIITAVLAITGTVMRSISVMCFYDNYIGYYERGAVFPIITNIFFAFSVLCFIVGYLIFVRKKEFHPEENRLPARVAALVPTIAFAVFTVIAVYRIAVYSYYSVNVSFLMYLVIPCGICGALYFAMIFLNKQKNIFGLLFGFLTIVWFVLAIASSYFNPNVPMNSPDKVIFQMGALGGMAYILGELRCTFSENKKALYIFSASAALLFLLSSSIPSIAVTLFGYGLYRYTLLPEDLVYFAVAVYVAVKFICFILPRNEVSEESNESEEKTEEEMPAADEESIEQTDTTAETDTDTAKDTDTEAETTHGEAEKNEVKDGEIL